MVGRYREIMSLKYIILTLAALGVCVSVGGCYSPRTMAFLGPRKIKVVDALTKHPLAGAHVELYASAGGCMGQATDEHGDMHVASGLLTTGLPSYDRIEITREGYVAVAFALTNGLPHLVELTAIQNQK